MREDASWFCNERYSAWRMAIITSHLDVGDATNMYRARSFPNQGTNV